MKRRTVVWLARGSVAASAALTAIAAILASRNGRPTGVFSIGGPQGGPLQILVIGAGLSVFVVVGSLIASRKPENAIGWLFCVIGVVFAFAQFAGMYGYHALDTNPGSLPGGELLTLLSDTLWLPTIAFITVFLLLLFPSGHPTTRTERITLRVAIAATIASALGGLTEAHLYGAPSIAAPIGIRVPGAVTDVLSGIAFFAITMSAVVSAVSLIRRFRRSRGEEREQLKWFVFAASLALVTLVPSTLFDSPPTWLAIASSLAILTLPISVGIAILKFRLYDIDIVIRKTVVYGMLAALLVAVGAVVILIVGGVAVGPVSDNGVALVAAGVVMGFAIWPLRTVATKIADRVVFGGRDTPYEVLTEFASRVGESYQADDVVPRMARILAEGTGAQHASVWLRVGSDLRMAASWPERSNGILPPDGTVDVRYQGEDLGALAVQMPANDPMTDTKHRLVEDLASQAGPVLRNVRLIEDLKASRQRLVATQDEERRKIERNIHDGAQQQLVALAVKLRLAEQIADRDAAKTKELLAQLQQQTHEVLEDLRDLARGIYPPLLADKGLVAALVAQARKVQVPTTVDAQEIGRYPQDVEAAVYFSCLEALQNVAKYAEATRASITLMNGDDRLVFRVVDDGVGFDPSDTRYGTGLQGMADRLAALDGELEIRSEPGRGTVVAGTVPAAMDVDAT